MFRKVGDGIPTYTVYSYIASAKFAKIGGSISWTSPFLTALLGPEKEKKRKEKKRKAEGNEQPIRKKSKIIRLHLYPLSFYPHFT